VSKQPSEKAKVAASYISAMPEAQRDQENQKSLSEAAAEHAEFKQYYDQKLCYLCKNSLDLFEKTKPCIHWLLAPKGFRSSDVAEVYKNFGVFQIQSFLRWLANEDNFAKNINDLVEDGKLGQVPALPCTIRYKNLEWSFSCSMNDFNGHADAKYARHPHYHLQIRRNGFVILKYSAITFRLGNLKYCRSKL